MSKLICFSPRLLIENHVEKQFVNTRYINRITARGYNTCLLTLGNPNPEDIFSLCDGFVITGGDDVDPISYHDENEGLSKDTRLDVDRYDLDLIHYAVTHHKPLLGICRGQQILNVYFGGTLHQDLGQLNSFHQSISSNHNLQMKNHLLFDWPNRISVNSYHHQSIKKLANDLEVLGTHSDHTIEMVMHKNLPIFAVQWHPEMTPDSDSSKIVFDAFIRLIEDSSL